VILPDILASLALYAAICGAVTSIGLGVMRLIGMPAVDGPRISTVHRRQPGLARNLLIQLPLSITCHV
jgi:hypothetical protein